MAVLVISDLPGVNWDDGHDASPMLARLRAQPGLLVHADGPADHGWRVVSIWESREDFQRFFDTLIKPNLPPGAPERDAVSDLRFVLIPNNPVNG